MRRRNCLLRRLFGIIVIIGKVCFAKYVGNVVVADFTLRRWLLRLGWRGRLGNLCACGRVFLRGVVFRIETATVALDLLLMLALALLGEFAALFGELRALLADSFLCLCFECFEFLCLDL